MDPHPTATTSPLHFIAVGSRSNSHDLPSPCVAVRSRSHGHDLLCVVRTSHNLPSMSCSVGSKSNRHDLPLRRAQSPSPVRDRYPPLDLDRVARALPIQPESIQTRASCQPLDSHPTLHATYPFAPGVFKSERAFRPLDLHRAAHINWAVQTAPVSRGFPIQPPDRFNCDRPFSI